MRTKVLAARIRRPSRTRILQIGRCWPSKVTWVPPEPQVPPARSELRAQPVLQEHKAFKVRPAIPGPLAPQVPRAPSALPALREPKVLKVRPAIPAHKAVRASRVRPEIRPRGV